MAYTLNDFIGEYENRRLTASLNRYLAATSRDHMKSKDWEKLEGDHRSARIVYKPLNLEMTASTYAPFKWVINKPSIKSREA